VITLILKRLATIAVLFPLLFVLLSVGGLGIGGAIVGARVRLENPQARDFGAGFVAGRQAGAQFGRRCGPAIMLGAAGVSGVMALVVPFTGLLPWCRRKSGPPPLPR